ncbi:MAG TPA: hypothetical protein VH092_04905 [Urbifossiella sp.]|jgi:hypothetical protein|nr:hypothetical protein [Urbifossiella sp.]
MNRVIRTKPLAAPGTRLEFQVSRGGKDVAITVPVGVFPLPYTVLLN